MFCCRLVASVVLVALTGPVFAEDKPVMQDGHAFLQRLAEKRAKYLTAASAALNKTDKKELADARDAEKKALEDHLKSFKGQAVSFKGKLLSVESKRAFLNVTPAKQQRTGPLWTVSFAIDEASLQWLKREGFLGGKGAKIRETPLTIEGEGQQIDGVFDNPRYPLKVFLMNAKVKK